VRSSNPGWRASVRGPASSSSSATAAAAAASQGLDSPTLSRDGGSTGVQGGQQPQTSYIYGYAGMHHTPGSPSVSTRTSISSASNSGGGMGAPPAAAAVGLLSIPDGLTSSVAATGVGSGGKSSVDSAADPRARLTGPPMTATTSSDSTQAGNHQYSQLSGTSRQNIAMAALNWSSLPVSGSPAAAGGAKGAQSGGGSGGSGPTPAASLMSVDPSQQSAAGSGGGGQGIPANFANRSLLGLGNPAHDLVIDDRSPSSLGLEAPPTEGMISEIPVLSPTYGVHSDNLADLSPRAPDSASPLVGMSGGEAGGAASSAAGLISSQLPKSPTDTQQSLLQRRLEQDLWGRNLSESLGAGATLSGSAGAAGSTRPGGSGPSRLGVALSSAGDSRAGGYGLEMGSRHNLARQSHSGLSRPAGDELGNVSPNPTHDGASPSSARRSSNAFTQGIDGDDGGGSSRLSSGRKGSRSGASGTHEGPFRAPPPLRLVPAPPTPAIAGAGHEGKYDWANFVFAYSRGKWDPHRLPRPPGQSTLHPGVKTRIVQPPPYAMATASDRGSGTRRSGQLGGREELGGGATPQASSSGPRGLAITASTVMVASPSASGTSLRANDLAAPAVSISPASPLHNPDSYGFDDNEERAALELAAPRRPSLTYVAESPEGNPGPNMNVGTSASSMPVGSLPSSEAPQPAGLSMPRRSVTAEEAAARVAAASRTAQALLQEREDAERAGYRGFSSEAGPRFESQFSPRADGSGFEAADGDRSGEERSQAGVGFACEPTFTSPFTNIAIRNMLEENTRRSSLVSMHSQNAITDGGPDNQSTPSMPVPLSPAASAPAEGLLDDVLLRQELDASRHRQSNDELRNMALSAALGTHITSQRSQTYGGSDQKFDALAYKRDAEAMQQRSAGSSRAAREDGTRFHGHGDEREQVDRNTGYRDRAESGEGGQVQSLPAKSGTKEELWESTSIGLSKKPIPEKREEGGSDQQGAQKVTETERTPAHPGGFKLDAKSQHKVEKLAKRDFEDQLEHNAKVSSSQQLLQSSVQDRKTILEADFAQVTSTVADTPQRPGPTPVQSSPMHSTGVPKDGQAQKNSRVGSTQSPHSGSGSSSGSGSFHNPPLHRRRRPSPSTNQGTPPEMTSSLARSYQTPLEIASSSSSPSASVRAVGLGAVAVGSASSGSSLTEGNNGGGDRPLPPLAQAAKDPLGSGAEAQTSHAPNVAREASKKPSDGTDSPAKNSETMTRQASYRGSPTPPTASTASDTTKNSSRSDASGKSKKRPGSSGGMHRPHFASPFVTIAGSNAAGWTKTGLDSSTVAELRLAASRRKSLETHPPVLLDLSGAQAGGGADGNTGTAEVGIQPGSTSKVNLNVAKQSGAALSLSGKLPLSTMSTIKGTPTAANSGAAALGMLKLQLTHSMSFPPDKEVKELWAKQGEVSGQDADAMTRTEKSSTDSSASRMSSNRSHSESILTFTAKHVSVTETKHGDLELQRSVEDVRRDVKAGDRGQSDGRVTTTVSKHTDSVLLSPRSSATSSDTLPAFAPDGSEAISLRTPVRSSTALTPGTERVSVSPVAASVRETTRDDDAGGACSLGPTDASPGSDSWKNAAKLQCNIGPDFGTAGRVGLTPSGSAAMNQYLTAGGRTEAFYIQNGYLPAIMPPNETERRQALRRYGPPKLAGNAHFDRIAHLVKLVFNTKLVLVSLVGENEQIFQTESGGGGSVTLQVLQRLAKSRDCSFCAHAILQDGDEPIVILDASRDWRFAGNPLVLGQPHIRFYAGSPLRTQDGYNIGSLCIIDDKPWTEFSPRQRHTLKEFARVVMREMELLRDRIQLGLRDSMQRSIENFTRECVEMDLEETSPVPPRVEETKSHTNSQGSVSTGSGSSQPVTIGLHRVYDMAARAMKDALQVTGAIIFDLSHLELLDTITHPDVDDPEAQNAILFPGPLHNAEFTSQGTDPHFGSLRSRELSIDSSSSADQLHDAFRRASDESIRYQIQQQQSRLVPPMAVLGSYETLAPPSTRDDPVPLSHHVKVAEFLRVHRAGRYFPFIPLPFQHLLPAGMSNVLMVPVFGLNKQPFAMLCAYTQNQDTGSSLDELKESGLQYLRAIGMIVLSAVLKKDIVLADKAKSHFISNISHELRTPLHGILAAAELLAETKLNSTQGSYLETVEACGKSLLELVNHVLDFTKLSGNSRSASARQNEKTRCDLVKLIQEVCESSWIGSIAKTLENKHSGIGSVYAPPQGHDDGSDSRTKKRIGGVAQMRETGVETVIDISLRETGWLVQCDAGGIRRVLMNLIGNSLKFTTSGFVHVSLREIQSTDTHVVVELAVTDTGRGISRSFLEEQLFHPFTQENPLGTGTGLGLSIVNSIVQSPTMNGKIDVWSTEGQGTEIRVTCELELSDPTLGEGIVYRPALKAERAYSIAMLSFGVTRGEEDLKEVVKSYLADWWGFEVMDVPDVTSLPDTLGDLILLNEDASCLQTIARRGGQLPPAIVLTSSRGDVSLTQACEAYHAAGGVARLLFKPAGPAKLESVLDFCVQCLERIRRGDPPDPQETKPSTPLPSPSPSPRESPAWRPGLEQQRSYFGPTADPVLGRDVAKKPTASDATPTDDKTPGSWNDLTPKPKAVGSPSVLHKHSPHISPNPPELSSTLLIRRHSTESKVTHHQAVDPSAEGETTPSAGDKPSRPLLPARSITYHEPRLHKHVLMSPHPGMRKGEGMQDYFGFVSSGAGASGGSPAERDSGSLPSSPGSTVSLEGGEGAVLKTALQSSSSTASASTRSGGRARKKLKILSVEDNPINRRVIQAFLAKIEDVEYVEATDGMQGVKAFAAHPPHFFDVILMDLSMPVLDGIGATAAIRRIELDRERAASVAGTSGGSSSLHGSTSLSATISESKTATTTTRTSATSSKMTSAASQTFATATASTNAANAATASAVSATAAAAVAASSSGPPSRLPHPRTRVKIFALTGRSTDEDKRNAFATGADGYIVKPLSYKVLASLLKMLAR